MNSRELDRGQGTWSLVEASQANISVKCSSRLSIEFPVLEIYQLDSVFNRIAAVQHTCHRRYFCNHCDTYNTYCKGYDSVKPQCYQTLIARERVMTYLCRQIFKSIERGHFQVWNSNFSEALELPSLRRIDLPNYQNYRWWCIEGHLLPEDLARSCADEKIHLEFFDYNRSGPVITARVEQPAGDISHQGSGPPDPANQDVKKPPETQAVSSPEALSVPVSKQRRFDTIGAEIHEILWKSPKLTPTQVMAALIARVGSSNSCVLANIGDGVTWEDGHGRQKPLNLELLSDRLRRWRMVNGATQGGE